MSDSTSSRLQKLATTKSKNFCSLTFRPFVCKQIDHNIAQTRFKEHRHADVPLLARRKSAPAQYICVLNVFVLAVLLLGSELKMEMTWSTVCVLLLLFVSATRTESSNRQLNTVRATEAANIWS